jgi:hypothetical protein
VLLLQKAPRPSCDHPAGSTYSYCGATSTLTVFVMRQRSDLKSSRKSNQARRMLCTSPGIRKNFPDNLAINQDWLVVVY